MIRKVFKMFVHPEAHVEYERRHCPIWKELEDTFMPRVQQIMTDCPGKAILWRRK